MNKSISSVKNPLVKKVVQLQSSSRERKKSGVFIVEGIREVKLALKGGYNIETLLFCSEIITEDNIDFISNAKKAINISSDVYKKIAYRTSTEGIIAIINVKEVKLNSLSFTSKNPLLLVAEAPEKPGNIGAILRTADAANVDAVLIANPKTDIYNPNIIRSSVGCIFTNTIATGSTQEIISFLNNKSINIYCAALQASKQYNTCDFKVPTAIIVGTEADGLSDDWLKNSTQNIIIPMQGVIDSMNVSVAAGILIFEAKRQRAFK
ncbi:TrmH family RNA methyltransferase [Patiriisocius hiemis]|uniref:RNA methyltransferase n=1 Tax=Patiriisocius hiemis TaxID=3075604 RepID=A0ABU2Y917_9FLAO|nr:RNA methyltransferase [Constantimarinum sp. W242]MDT0554674.1 RNA methyltransferase [Constantimarinum sp. W242]